jgi:hypothetical protein
MNIPTAVPYAAPLTSASNHVQRQASLYAKLDHRTLLIADRLTAQRYHLYQ